MGQQKEMSSENIKMHEGDISFLQMKKKLLIKQLAEIEREILILSQYNREMKGRSNINEDHIRKIENNKL
jgi:phage repressor protein C with HTH and peptisase S24 domain